MLIFRTNLYQIGSLTANKRSIPIKTIVICAPFPVIFDKICILKQVAYLINGCPIKAKIKLTK